MAFIVISIGGEEISRHPLEGATVIGRNSEAKVSVRDASMSRQHCRIEPMGGDHRKWEVIDLGSRNGTTLNGRRITRHELHGGDMLRIGRVTVSFKEGAFVAAPDADAPTECLSRPLCPPSKSELPQSATAANFSRPLLVPADRLPRPVPGSKAEAKRAAFADTELMSSPGWSRNVGKRPPAPSVDLASGDLSESDKKRTMDVVMESGGKGAERPSFLRRLGVAFRGIFGR